MVRSPYRGSSGVGEGLTSWGSLLGVRMRGGAVNSMLTPRREDGEEQYVRLVDLVCSFEQKNRTDRCVGDLERERDTIEVEGHGPSSLGLSLGDPLLWCLPKGAFLALFSHHQRLAPLG